MGGLLNIWAIPANQLSVYGNILSVGNTDNIYKIYCSPDSMQYATRSEKVNEGTIYHATVKGFAPGVTSDLEKVLNEMAPLKWAVLVKDGNENFLLAGTNLFPLLLSANTNTGLDSPDRAGCEFLFSGMIPFSLKMVNDPF